MVSLVDLYDEEFNRLLRLSRCLIQQLPRRDDRCIAVKWIRKLCAMRTRDASVKRNRNCFFRYMLTVLLRALHENNDQKNDTNHDFESEAGRRFMHRWSHDTRTYVAAKPLPGRGALVYMAVSKDPSLGWDRPHRDTV